MNDNPIQVIIAAFNSPDGAGQVMADLKAGKKEGLIGILDAAVVVKDAEGQLKITDSKRRSRKGFVTGGLIGGALGLLAGPVGWLAVGGGALGALAGKAAGSPLKSFMEDIGSSLTPNSSAIVAAIEHTWVGQVEAMLAAEGAYIAKETIKADIAQQLSVGGSVLYTAAAGPQAAGIARVAESPAGAQVSALIASDEGVLISDAQFVAEEEIDEASGEEAEAGVAEEKKNE